MFFIFLILDIAFGWSVYTFNSTCVSDIAQAQDSYCVTVTVNSTNFNILVGNHFSPFVLNSLPGDILDFSLPDPNFIAEMDPTCTSLRTMVTYQQAISFPFVKNVFEMICVFPKGNSLISVKNANTLEGAKFVNGLDDRFILMDEWWSIMLANWNVY